MQFPGVIITKYRLVCPEMSSIISGENDYHPSMDTKRCATDSVSEETTILVQLCEPNW